MEKFHRKTLQLLEETDYVLEPLSETEMSAILAQGKQLGITIPAAYLEYLAFGGVEALCELSNSDDFPILDLMTLPDGRQALMFHMEHQGNFEKCCLLDEGDDPPVLYGWIGCEPWIDFGSFSEAIYAQIFDWQLQLSGNGYCADVVVNDIPCLSLLAPHFTADIVTHYSIEEVCSTELRYLSTDKGRIHLFFRDDGLKLDGDGARAVLNIYHADKRAGEKLHSQILEILQGFLVPRRFYCPHKPEDVIEYLERKLAKGLLTHIQYCCAQPPTQDVLQAMQSANQKKPFTKRGRGFVFAWSHYWHKKNTPNFEKRDAEKRGCEKIGTTEVYVHFGGKAWGGVISLRQLHHKGSWYVIDKIEAC